MDAVQNQNLTKKERRELKRQEKLKEKTRRRQIKQFKRIGLWSLVVVGIAGSIFGMVRLVGSGGGTSGQAALLVGAISPEDHTKGAADTGVTLVEYSDFQCPACGYYFPFVKQLNEEFQGKIQFVYRNFPLRQAHRNAELAARAAEAAGKQGKFWEMHDKLFENQSTWSEKRDAREIFIGYASSLGLDIEKFKQDIDSYEVKGKIEADFQSGIKSGVNSTPTFFLNGKKISNPANYDGFRALVSQALGQSQ